MRKTVAEISIDAKSIPKITILAILLTAITILYTSWLTSIYSLFGRLPRHGSINLLLITLVGTLIIHEFIHALAFISFKVKPQFGAKLVAQVLPVLTTSSKGAKLSIRRMLIVGLCPLVLISIITSLLAAIPSITGYAILAFSVNFIGSVGDIYMSILLIKYFNYKDVMVKDTGTSFLVTTG